MDKNISEIFDYGDEIVVVEEQDNPLDPARIKELTMKKIESGAIREEIGKTVKKARPVYRTVLIAAIVAILLIGTAFAVYQISIRDTLTGETSTWEYNVWENASEEPTPFAVERLEKALTGLPGSPEYQAYVEWSEWNAAWWVDNPDPWKELGVDDSWHETPDNYAHYYDAYFNEQGEKLDEIAQEYCLTLHTTRAPFETEDDLCAVLGISEIASGIDRFMNGYVFEDGSFRFSAIIQEDPEIWADVCLAAKGSLSLFSDEIDVGFDDWSYTTADGTNVALAMADVSAYPEMWIGPVNSWLVAQFDNALLSVNFRGIGNREELEAFADKLNLSGLAEVFSAKTDRSYISSAAAAQQEAWQTAQDAQLAEQEQLREAQEAYVNQHASDEWGELIRTELGDWFLPETLEGQHYAGSGLVVVPTRHAIRIEYSDDSYVGDMQYVSTYQFLYERDWSDETHTQSTTREEFEELLRVMQEDGNVFEVKEVGGYDVYVCGSSVIWYDEGRDLQFSIYDCHPAFDPETFTGEQFVGLAESFIASINAD